MTDTEPAITPENLHAASMLGFDTGAASERARIRAAALDLSDGSVDDDLEVFLHDVLCIIDGEDGDE